MRDSATRSVRPAAPSARAPTVQEPRYDHLSPAAPFQTSQADTQVPRMVSVTSNMPTQGTMTPVPPEETPLISPSAASVTPTTHSHVKRLVEDSKYHDETLCQLLDAARLNLIGEEAKRALNRAAKARVADLRDLRDRGEVSCMRSG